ncbi:hypothetical protein [Natranaerobius trueperi]|uniref:hypothetical protein n=1 Tax=Natranaerobius trueperi TaxID=759412 RepID=UPI00197B5C3C
MKRIEKGYFVRNLDPNNVEVIVFWTKNPEPFINNLDLLQKRVITVLGLSFHAFNRGVKAYFFNKIQL